MTPEECKKILDEVSPSFCIAKWKQVSMHLESGLTHSCHHPKAHIVPLDELEKNVSALHNTNFKKNVRKDMLEGREALECRYCNVIEKETPNDFSDRVYKSMNPGWAWPYLEEIKNTPWDADVFPSYFEVSFSSTCNCRCIYCSSTFSSQWAKEIEKYGDYPSYLANRGFGEADKPKYQGKDKNPYIDAFWKWWPDLYENLHTFRITGGEPLLSPNTFKVLDYIIEHPRENLNFSINSNMCIKKPILDRFIEKCKRITENLKVINLFTSCEAHGKHAEYIRWGMNYNEYMDNCHRFLDEVDGGSISFTATYNVFSITSFTKFLKDILALKQEFKLRVRIDIPTLMNPQYLQAKVITREYLDYVRESIHFMYTNPHVTKWLPLSGKAFWTHETEKLHRIYNGIVRRPEDNLLTEQRKNFALFIDERDRRYKSNFLKTFPEYEEFYTLCKSFL
jgi:organic radical activating enzyme